MIITDNIKTYENVTHKAVEDSYTSQHYMWFDEDVQISFSPQTVVGSRLMYIYKTTI